MCVNSAEVTVSMKEAEPPTTSPSLLLQHLPYSFVYYTAATLCNTTIMLTWPFHFSVSDGKLLHVYNCPRLPAFHLGLVKKTTLIPVPHSHTVRLNAARTLPATHLMTSQTTS